MAIRTNQKKTVLETVRNQSVSTEPTSTAANRHATTMEDDRPFTRVNFYMMGGCVALIVLGFILMSGGQSADPQAFNPEIFSTRRIVVGPLLAFLGFLLMAFAIIYSPGKKKGTDKVESAKIEENGLA